MEGWRLFPGHQEVPHRSEHRSPSVPRCFQAPPPRPPAVAQRWDPSWLQRGRAGGGGGVRLAACSPSPLLPTARCSCSVAPALQAAPLRLLQTEVLWPWLPAAQQHSGGSCGRAAPLHTPVMAPLGAVWENDFNPSHQKQISYISSVHTDRAEVKCLLFFLLDSKRS